MFCNLISNDFALLIWTTFISCDEHLLADSSMPMIKRYKYCFNVAARAALSFIFMFCNGFSPLFKSLIDEIKSVRYIDKSRQALFFIN